MIALEIDPILTRATSGVRALTADWGEAVDRTWQAPEPPPDLDALRERGERHFAEGRAAEACFVFERLIAQLERIDDGLERDTHAAERARLHYRLAYLAEKRGDPRTALAHYRSSCRLDGEYFPALEGLASALLRAEKWEEARQSIQTILIHHADELTEAEVVELEFQLGEIALNLFQHRRAYDWYRRALDLDADHPPALRRRAELAETFGEWEAAFEARARLLRDYTGADRFERLIDQARLCRDNLHDAARSIEVFDEARRLRPHDTGVLRALADLYDHTGQIRAKIDILTALTPHLTGSEVRREHFVELARSWFQEDDHVRVVEQLNLALDEDPAFIDAFQEIEQILFKSRDWQALAANYRRMIKRIPKQQGRARSILWRSLGGLYRKRLRSWSAARIAYQAVARAEPGDEQIAHVLAEIYAERRETVPLAISIYHRLLGTSADPATPARRLFELYSGLDQLDRAFCALGALIVLGAATDIEKEAYQLLLKRAPKAAAGALTDELWRDRVLHPDCRSPLAEICRILYRGAPDLFADAQKALRLKKREKVQLDEPAKDARARLLFVDVCSGLSGALAVDEVDQYHRPGSTEAPRLCAGSPPVLFVGERNASFEAVKPSRLRWTIARELATVRPEIAPAFALAPDALRAALEAACELACGSAVVASRPQTKAWKKALARNLSAEARAALLPAVHEALERGDLGRLAEFIDGAHHTACRAAMLVAQDAAATDCSHAEALARFTLSEDHVLLRERLGLSIAVHAA